MPRARKTKPRNPRTPRSRKPPVERGPDVPHWLPAGTCWEKLPQIIRDAVARFVAPAYCRFVLEAPSQIERAIGATLVHLMWLELCGQLQMAQAAVDPESLDALLQNPEVLIARHLHLASVKCQTAELMVKLRVINDALERGKPILPALTPGPSPASGRAETAALPAPATLLLPPLDPAHPGPRTLNPEPSPKLENRRTADQLSHPALELVASRPDLFSRQG